MTTRTAAVYRMVMEDHVCPYGIKTVDLLTRQGFEVEDHHLTSREETDAFKDKHNVETTPQTFIEDKRIGGYDDVREFFGKSWKTTTTTSRDPITGLAVPGAGQ